MNGLAHQSFSPDPWKSSHHKPDQDGLLGLVNDAIERVNWPAGGESFGLSDAVRFPARLIMILEVYCDARGIYESSLVEHFAREHPDLSPLFEGHPPDAACIREFRRRHQEPIKRCLIQLFELALRVRFGAPESEEAPVDFCVARALDSWFEPICGPRPSVEAQERLAKVILWDEVLNSR